MSNCIQMSLEIVKRPGEDSRVRNPAVTHSLDYTRSGLKPVFIDTNPPGSEAQLFKEGVPGRSGGRNSKTWQP